jgi:hypothetical protein
MPWFILVLQWLTLRHIWVLFAAYGLYYAMVEGVSRAFVADLAPAEKEQPSAGTMEYWA